MSNTITTAQARDLVRYTREICFHLTESELAQVYTIYCRAAIRSEGSDAE